VPDSGGPGEYRGGTGLEMELQLDQPQSMVTARNRDRSVISAWGLRGGRSGAVSRFVKNPDTAGSIELGSQDLVKCDPGDVILIQGPGAGGYGSPLDRPVEKVLADVRQGLVSADRAKSDYGVVIAADGGVDQAATVQLRGQLRSDADGAEFGHGPGRLAFEAVWTEARYDALTGILAKLPVTWRYFVKHEIFRQIQGPPVDGSDGANEVYRAYTQVTDRFADLPKAS